MNVRLMQHYDYFALMKKCASVADGISPVHAPYPYLGRYKGETANSTQGTQWKDCIIIHFLTLFKLFSDPSEI